MSFPERSVMDADRPLCCGLTTAEPETQLGLRNRSRPSPVSWFPGREVRYLWPAEGQMVPGGCSGSGCSRMKWSLSPPHVGDKLLALCSAFLVACLWDWCYGWMEVLKRQVQGLGQGNNTTNHGGNPLSCPFSLFVELSQLSATSLDAHPP